MATNVQTYEPRTLLNLYRHLPEVLVKYGYQYQEFTEPEQECISEKISKLRDEGVDQEEAVARAIKECAPEKSKSRGMT